METISKEDVIKYYKDTVVDIKNKATGAWVRGQFLNWKEEPTSYAHILDFSKETVVDVRVSFVKNDIRPFLPQTGYYNSIYNENNLPIYCVKNGNRQYKKSFCSGLYYMEFAFNLSSNPYIPGYLFASSYKDYVKGIVCFSKYYNYQQAIYCIDNQGFFGVALNLDFAISLGYEEGVDYSLWWREFLIANITGKKIVPKEEIFKQEILDWIRRDGVDLYVD